MRKTKRVVLFTKIVQPHIISNKMRKQFSSKQQLWESINTNKREIKISYRRNKDMKVIREWNMITRNISWVIFSVKCMNRLNHTDRLWQLFSIWLKNRESISGILVPWYWFTIVLSGSSMNPWFEARISHLGPSERSLMRESN